MAVGAVNYGVRRGRAIRPYPLLSPGMPLLGYLFAHNSGTQYGVSLPQQTDAPMGRRQ